MEILSQLWGGYAVGGNVMERLTQPGIDYCKDVCGGMGVCARFTAAEMKMMLCGDAAIYKKLQELEDAETEGRLLVVPAEVYQTDAERIYRAKIRRVIYEAEGGLAFDDRAIGDTVFLTRADAEAALRRQAE